MTKWMGILMIFGLTVNLSANAISSQFLGCSWGMAAEECEQNLTRGNIQFSVSGDEITIWSSDNSQEVFGFQYNRLIKYTKGFPNDFSAKKVKKNLRQKYGNPNNIEKETTNGIHYVHEYWSDKNTKLHFMYQDNQQLYDDEALECEYECKCEKILEREIAAEKEKSTKERIQKDKIESNSLNGL